MRGKGQQDSLATGSDLIARHTLQRQWRRYIPAALTACAGVTLSLVVFAVLRGWETRSIQVDFQRAAEEGSEIIKGALEADLWALESIQGLYAASVAVEREEFSAFAQPLLKNHPSVRALEWIPRVADAERTEFEAAARADGLTSFQICQRDARQQTTAASWREEYFPVLFIEPHKGNEAALGFDVASEPARQAGLSRARDTGKAVATARIRLVQDAGEGFGFRAFLPVYGKGEATDTLDDRRRNLQGFVSGVFRVADVVEASLAHLRPSDIDVYLYDASAPAGEGFLYFHPSRTRKRSPLAKPLESGDMTGIRQTSSLQIGGREWSILCMPAPGFIAGRRTWEPWGALVGGLLGAGLLAAYLLAAIGRTERIERLVEAQTDQLRESEQKLAGLVDSLADHISMIDRQYTVVWANNVAKRLFGRNLVGKKCYRAYHKRDVPCDSCVVRQAYLDGKVHEHETEAICADGSSMSFWCTASVVALHEDGRPKLVVEVSRDVTSRKQAARDLERSARQWNDTFDAINDAVCLLDQEGKVLKCNRAMGELVDRSPGELVGRRCWEVVHGASGPIAACPGVRARSSKRRETLEVTLGKRWVNVVADPVFDEQGQYTGCVFIISDIMDRKQIEQELSKSNQNLLQLNRRLQATARGIQALMRHVIDNQDFSARFENPSLVSCWQAQGCDRRECPCYGQQEHLRCWEIAGTMCDGKPLSKPAQELGDCRKCAVCRSARADAVHELGETFNEMILILGNRQRDLADARGRAETASRAKTEFLANFSHEIRTPLTAILGFADVLLKSLDLPEPLEAAGIIKRNGTHLLQVINDVLDLSKIEAGRLQVERVPCRPHQILAEVASSMRVWADAKGLPLRLEYAGPIPETISTDPTRLRQILVNLVGNAVKLTEAGSIRVVTRLTQDAQQPRLRFDVIDTGIGMSDEEIGRLFDPYSQGDASAGRRFGGSSRGLAVSRRLAGMLGGDVTVTSTPGEGSTQSVTVATGPLQRVRLVERPGEAALAAEPSEGNTSEPDVRLDCQILLAEDCPDNQRLMSFLLKSAGAEVVLADNGQVALAKVLDHSPEKEAQDRQHERPFDVILMDMQMPVMDGYEATRKLRAAGYAGPIIAVTAHAMSDDRDKCLNAGCDDYLTKPLDRRGLLEIVARHVRPEGQPAEMTTAADADGEGRSG